MKSFEFGLKIDLKAPDYFSKTEQEYLVKILEEKCLGELSRVVWDLQKAKEKKIDDILDRLIAENNAPVDEPINLCVEDTESLTEQLDEPVDLSLGEDESLISTVEVRKPIRDLELLKYLDTIMNVRYNANILNKLRDAIDNEILAESLEEQVESPLFLHIKYRSQLQLLKLVEYYKRLSFVIAILNCDELTDVELLLTGYEKIPDKNLGYDIYQRVRK